MALCIQLAELGVQHVSANLKIIFAMDVDSHVMEPVKLRKDIPFLKLVPVALNILSLKFS